MKRCSVLAAVAGLVMSTLCQAAPTIRWMWEGQPMDFVLDETDSRGLGAYEFGGSFGLVESYFVGPVIADFDGELLYSVIAVGDTGVVYDATILDTGAQGDLAGFIWDNWQLTGQWQSTGSIDAGTFSIDADEFVSFRVPEPGAALTLAIPAVSYLRRRR